MRSAKPVRIKINGEPQEVDQAINLSKLVATLGLKPEQIAIELNQNVARRADWPNTLLRPDDKIEIVHFVGGGASKTRRQ